MLHLFTLQDLKNISLYLCKYRDQVTIVPINYEMRGKTCTTLRICRKPGVPAEPELTACLGTGAEVGAGEQVNWKQKFSDEMGQ